MKRKTSPREIKGIGIQLNKNVSRKAKCDKKIKQKEKKKNQQTGAVLIKTTAILLPNIT